MSGTLEGMMTPEQARMALEAFRSRLNVDSPAAQSLTAGTGMPLEFISTAARQQAAPTEAPAEAPAATPSPVVTSGMASQVGPPAPADTGTTPQADVDALARLRQLIGGEQPSQEDRGREALMNFFFSMAASRNPSFFGQLGEAGQALSQADRTARAEARQERQLDVEAGFRAAQESRQAAELQWAQDPRNPLNIQRLAAARAAETEARARLMSAGASARRERLGTGYEVEDLTTGRQGVAYMGASGQPVVRWLPENLRRAQTPQQQALEDQRRAQNYLNAERAARELLSQDMQWPALSEAERRRRLTDESNRILTEIERRQRSGTTQPDQQPQTALPPPSGRITIPYQPPR